MKTRGIDVEDEEVFCYLQEFLVEEILCILPERTEVTNPQPTQEDTPAS